MDTARKLYMVRLFEAMLSSSRTAHLLSQLFGNRVYPIHFNPSASMSSLQSSNAPDPSEPATETTYASKAATQAPEWYSGRGCTPYLSISIAGMKVQAANAMGKRQDGSKDRIVNKTLINGWLRTSAKKILETNGYASDEESIQRVINVVKESMDI